MKLCELKLIESVSFTVSVLSDDKKYYDSTHASLGKVEHGECPICDGTKIDYNGEACRTCNATGYINQFHADYKELNVSNDSAEFILRDLLRVPKDDDYLAGAIQRSDFAEMRRRLIKLKNQDLTAYTTDSHVDMGQMKIRGKTQNGVVHIGRGAKMIHGARSKEQIERYIDQLLELINYAQKHENAYVTWA